MKSLIIYSSKTGNTRKLAEAVCDFLPGETIVKPAMDNPSQEGYDLVVICFWLQGGKPDPNSAKVLEKSTGKIFLLATHGAAADSVHAAGAMAAARELAGSADVVGEFNCQGEVNPDFLKKAAAKKPQPPWVQDAADAVGHPDANDIAELKKVLLEAVSSIS
ncbi:flavodoxin [Desulfomarina profundi]|uniref:Flavodoxin n=1 Tax=Desulfomarina profundi TaxID=2772557 RepID=A0A8D5G082_9BACT|nr:flavodoxin family protein [Desulfomarina profundi]BCL63167.1 flavodoxin [Desulfomarina profundi]